jgi:hypothetical protein
MNGHSTAETLAFCMTDIALRWPAIGDREDTPVFVFASGPGSGEREIVRRLTRAMVDEAVVDASLVGALATQLARTAHAVAAIDASDTLSTASTRDERLAALVRSHAAFLRNVCLVENADARDIGWGISAAGFSAELALYLKVVFPRSKFVFVHRNPLDAFAAALNALKLSAGEDERDWNWVESFAEVWCQFVASFELWHAQVDGILLSYEAATAREPAKLEHYLGGRVSPLGDSDVCSTHRGVQLRADEILLLVERTGEIASRLGYALSGTPSPTVASIAPRAVATARAVHVDATRTACAVLVPAMRYIEPECDEALAELERRGYAVMRMRGCSSIDQARNVLATAAIEQGFAETIWIDADTEFNPDAVERIRSHAYPVVAGIYARKGARAGFAFAEMPGARELVMGDSGGLTEILYAGTGFLLVRREVYLAIQQRFNLPLCDEGRRNRAIPFFMPMLEDWGGRMSYLGEDYAFSRRARLCGYKIIADTTIRLWHIGPYRYGYEDAGNGVERVATYRHVFESDDRRGA